MGEICEYQTHGEFYEEKERRHRKYRSKFFFTLTLLDELYSTKRNATVPMPDLLAEALRECKINQEIKADEKGIILTDNSNLIFCNDDD